jgi:hypothetical protein
MGIEPDPSLAQLGSFQITLDVRATSTPEGGKAESSWGAASATNNINKWAMMPTTRVLEVKKKKHFVTRSSLPKLAHNNKAA